MVRKRRELYMKCSDYQEGDAPEIVMSAAADFALFVKSCHRRDYIPILQEIEQELLTRMDVALAKSTQHETEIRALRARLEHMTRLLEDTYADEPHMHGPLQARNNRLRKAIRDVQQLQADQQAMVLTFGKRHRMLKKEMKSVANKVRFRPKRVAPVSPRSKKRSRSIEREQSPVPPPAAMEPVLLLRPGQLVDVLMDANDPPGIRGGMYPARIRRILKDRGLADVVFQPQENEQLQALRRRRPLHTMFPSRRAEVNRVFEPGDRVRAIWYEDNVRSWWPAVVQGRVPRGYLVKWIVAEDAEYEEKTPEAVIPVNAIRSAIVSAQ